MLNASASFPKEAIDYFMAHGLWSNDPTNGFYPETIYVKRGSVAGLK